MREDLKEILKRLCSLSGKSFDRVDEEKLIKHSKECLDIIEKEIKDYSKQLEEYSMTMEAHLEELTRTYEELATVFEVNKILGEFEYPYKTLDKVKKVLSVLKNAIPYKGAIVYLKTPEEEISYKEGIEELVSPVEEKLAEYDEIHSVILRDSLKESEFGKMNLLVVPVKSPRSYWGYIAFIEKSKGIFTAADRKMVESVAQQISSALDRVAFMKDEVERQRMKEQLEIAKNIQMSLFPKVLPKTEKIKIAASSVPAIHVGGDYYDAFEYAGGILAIVADVSGKGIPAALLMSSARAALRSFSKVKQTLKELIMELNTMLAEDLTEDRFITMMAMLIKDDGTLNIVNAGHDPIYIVKDGKCEEITAEGIPLGIFPGFEYEERLLSVPEGAFVVAYTDGVPEARNIEGEEFGFERLKKVLKNTETDDPEKLMLKIKEAVFEFSRGAPRHDDTTIMVIRYS